MAVDEKETEEIEETTVTLEFEDGCEEECEPLFVFEVDGKDYVALVPVDESSDDVYLYGYKDLGENEFELLDIEDDETFEKVGAEFDRIIEEAEAMEEE